MRVMGLAGRCVVTMGLLGVGLTACQWVAGIEDIELTSSSSAAASSSGSGTGGTTGASSSASSSASASSASASSSSSGGGPTTLHYNATVTDCVNINAPDPNTCETAAGMGKIRIDTFDNASGQPLHAFLRFDLDNALAGRTVVSVKLNISTTANNTSNNSGEIWQVSSFDRPALFMKPLPANVGASPVAADLGPVMISTTYSWPLPTNLVAANMNVYLKLVPLNSTPLFYWNTMGMVPPELVIDVQ